MNYPSRQSWESLGDRAVTCAVSNLVGQMEGSVAGAGRQYAAAFFGACTDRQLRIVDCAGGHAAEVYLVTEISGDEYPGEQAVQNAASELCHDPFADYVGVEYEDSALEVIYFWPKQRRWDHGDHGVMCAAFDPKGPLTGSVKGTSR